MPYNLKRKTRLFAKVKAPLQNDSMDFDDINESIDSDTEMVDCDVGNESFKVGEPRDSSIQIHVIMDILELILEGKTSIRILSVLVLSVIKYLIV